MNDFQLYIDRFVVDHSAYLVQQQDGSHRAVYEPVSLDIIARHLNGSITIALPGANLDGYSKWICFDDDNRLPEGQSGLLDKLQAHLTASDYCSFREGIRYVSDGILKQGHLWVVLEQPVPSVYARSWAQRMIRQAGIANDTTDAFEIFPKNTTSKKIAFAVRAPLGRHAKANNEFIWFPHVSQNAAEQLAYLLSQPLNNASNIEFLGKREAELTSARTKYRWNTFHKDLGRTTCITAPEIVFEDLRPVRHNSYFTCRCPACGMDEAFFYPEKGLLICNRKLNCGFCISSNEYQHYKGEQS